MARFLHGRLTVPVLRKPGFLVLLMSVWCFGCGLEGGTRRSSLGALPIPQISDLSTRQASVGDPLVFFGDGFVDPGDGWVDVVFEGTFTPNDNSEEVAVDLTVPLQRQPDGTLIWEQFGEYKVPFLPAGNKLGFFRGNIYAVNNFFPNSDFFTGPEGSVRQEAAELTTDFHVLPSLVVLDNRAFGDDFIADCIDPSTTVLQNLRYALRVRALGFVPASYEFVLDNGSLQISGDRFVVNEDKVRVRTAVPGGRTEQALVHRWSEVPDNLTGYATSVTATGIGVGIERSVQFRFVVRPWVYPAFESGSLLAELLDPVPVTGCIPGGPNSVRTTYEDKRSEVRSRALSVNLDRDYAQALATEHTQSYDFTNSERFTRTRSQDVSVINAATTENTEAETDLFSLEDARTRESLVGWRSETSQWNTGFLEARGTRSSDDERVKAALERLGIDGPVTNTDETGGITEDEVTVSTSIAANASRRSTFSVEDFSNQVTGATNSSTRGVNLQEGRSWGFTNTYGQQVGLAEERSRAREESYGQAIAYSREVEEAVGTSESEVMFQSSTEAIGRGFSGFVWAGLEGTWYRQASRYEIPGVMVAHDYCGNATRVAEIRVSEWVWAVDLGIQEECPPRTNFLPATCHSETCQ